MAVKEIKTYVVEDRNGKEVGRFMDKKTADILDNRTDAMYDLADKMAALGFELTDEQTEQLAEWMLDDRKDIVGILKKVKDMPKDDVADDSDEDSESNVVELDQAF